MKTARVEHVPGRTAPGLRTRLLWTAADAGVWVGSLVVATWLRLDFTITEQYLDPLALAAVVVVVVHVTLGWIFGPYAVGHELGSFESHLLESGRNAATCSNSRASVTGPSMKSSRDARERMASIVGSIHLHASSSNVRSRMLS